MFIHLVMFIHLPANIRHVPSVPLNQRVEVRTKYLLNVIVVYFDYLSIRPFSLEGVVLFWWFSLISHVFT